MKNIEPAVQTMFVQYTVAPGALVDHTVDLSQIASLANRRFYRQGLNWAVAGIKVITNAAATGSIISQKLPNTWTLANSWTKGFKTWQEMNKKALEETEGVQGRFLDFKIYADSIHHTAGYGANLLPRDSTGAVATPGEWIPSEIRAPNGSITVPFELIGVGDNYPGVGASGIDAVSLVQGYANSRSLPDVVDPNTPAEATDAIGLTPENWMSALSNEGTNQDSEVIADLTAYDQPPYPYENDGTAVTTMYPGGGTQLPGLEVSDTAFFTGTTIGNISYLKGGNFPCGLMRFNTLNSGSQPLGVSLLIDLVPGHHRGYMAESMLEM